MCLIDGLSCPVGIVRYHIKGRGTNKYVESLCPWRFQWPGSLSQLGVHKVPDIIIRRSGPTKEIQEFQSAGLAKNIFFVLPLIVSIAVGEGFEGKGPFCE